METTTSWSGPECDGEACTDMEHRPGCSLYGYGWVIDTDHLVGITDHNEAGVMGPSTLTEAMRARLLAGEGEPFRMLDDDGELYYSGRLIGGHGDEPLDDFGAPNAGCTVLQQFRNGRWETVIG